MAPKKKPSKNGYWQFFLETRDKITNKHMSQQELQNYANRKWVAMSSAERAPYQDRAQLSRNGHQGTRFTSDGVAIDEIERNEQLNTQRQHDMRNTIKRTLKNEQLNGTLPDHVFFTIAVNHLGYVPSEDKYFVCEVSIAAFTLRSGILDVFWMDVKPGKLPLGFYGSAKTYCKDSHQMLELAQEEPCINNTHEVFTNMLAFLKRHSHSLDSFTLYNRDKTLDATSAVMKRFCEDFNCSAEVKIYSFEYMFYLLKNTVTEREFWPNESYAMDIVEKDVYCYTPNLSCDFHSVGDISVHCTKSIVKRLAYTICDHCCSDLNISLIPGTHIPMGSRISAAAKKELQSETGSVCSNDDFIPVTRRHHRNSFSSTDYDDNGQSGSSRAPSVMSFSTLDGQRPQRAPGQSRTAARIEQSFRAMSVNDTRRDRSNLQLPKHGCSFTQ